MAFGHPPYCSNSPISSPFQPLVRAQVASHVPHSLVHPLVRSLACAPIRPLVHSLTCAPVHPPIRFLARAPIHLAVRTSSHIWPQESLGSVASLVENSNSDEIFHDCVVIDWASFELQEVLKKIDVNPPRQLSPTTNYNQGPSKTDSSLKGDPASIIGHNGSETTSRDSTSRDEVTAMVKTVVVSKLGEDAHAVACPISPLDPSKTNGIIEVPHHSEVIVTHPASLVPVLA